MKTLYGEEKENSILITIIPSRSAIWKAVAKSCQNAAYVTASTNMIRYQDRYDPISRNGFTARYPITAVIRHTLRSKQAWLMHDSLSPVVLGVFLECFSAGRSLPIVARLVISKLILVNYNLVLLSADLPVPSTLIHLVLWYLNAKFILLLCSSTAGQPNIELDDNDARPKTSRPNRSCLLRACYLNRES